MPRLDRRRTAWSLLVASVLAIGLAVWLFTLDIYPSQGRDYGGTEPVDRASAFCGSAYDVVLLRGDGFMGGEMPSNQDVLNQECVRQAGRSVLGAGVAGGVGSMLLLWALLLRRRVVA